MLHIIHLIEHRFGRRASRMVAILALSSSLALAIGLVLAAR
jgi:hypothetical protein